jgi:hypothetical protein
MKRIISLVTAIILLFGVLTALNSCDRSYNEEEVKAAALTLIPESLFLNEIYWGKGIPYVSGNSNGAYHEANFLALSEYGFHTVEELKTLTRKTFSKGYCSYIFSTSFSSIMDNEEVQFLARYYQKYTDETQTVPECIMVYSQFENLLPDKVEYLYDSLKVTHSEKDVVFVSVKARVERNGNVQYRDKKIGLIEEEDGWRIDTTTYLTYNEYKNEYEDLKKQ